MFDGVSFDTPKMLIYRHVAQKGGKYCNPEGKEGWISPSKLRKIVNCQTKKEHDSGDEQGNDARTFLGLRQDGPWRAALIAKAVFFFNIGTAGRTKHRDHLYHYNIINASVSQPILRKVPSDATITKRK